MQLPGPVRALVARLEQWKRWPEAALALVAYVPLLLTRPGQVGADTKTYLYLDPGRLLTRAAWMWEPRVGLGTITHQNIGYLWPMGPYYWLLQTLGLPDWVAQRLWLGSIILAAGLGVRYLLTTIGWDSAGRTVAAFAYALSPYLLHYGARISVILLPFAGLPWLIALAARGLRTGGWRYPACFALVVMTVGGVNATSLLLVMVGPGLWFVHAVWVEREVTLGRGLATAARIGVLTLATSTWWMAGLAIQGSFGINILKYTESYKVVADSATSTELLRGLGYWFFYGRDNLGAWINAAIPMTQVVPVLLVSFLVPLTAFASALFTRWRHRSYFVALLGVGLLIAVAAHPYASPSPLGAVFKGWTRSESGLAFRSTPRAVPLIALATSVFLGSGIALVGRLRPRWRPIVAVGALVMIGVSQPGLFLGRMVDRNLTRDENIPEYWRDAAAELDRGNRDTRVLEMPGTDFASYRWGNTVDPITPGLTTRDYAARELIPYGSPASASLMNALDFPYQEGTAIPAALAPMLRLMGVGQVVARNDLQYERYRTPRPDRFWADLLNTPGLKRPKGFGTPAPNRAIPSLPLRDELALGTPLDLPDPPPVGILSVENPRPMLRTVSATAPVILAGDAQGLVAAAGAGLIDPDRPVLFSATHADEPDQLRAEAAQPGAEVIITDSNRRQAWRWGSVRENHGLTETAYEVPLVTDVTDNRLDVFPDQTADHQTVAEPEGGASVRVSGYGNAVSYTPGDRGILAFDGDPRTSWKVGAFAEVTDETLQVDFDRPTEVDHLTLLQEQRQTSRWITGVRLEFDPAERSGSEPLPPVEAKLTDASRTTPGQTITFPKRRVGAVRIVITGTNLGELPSYKGASEVGFAEISLADLRLTDVIRTPVDVQRVLGRRLDSLPLTFVLRRQASNPEEVVVDDEEVRMHRLLDVPGRRTFTLRGSARLPTEMADEVIDRLVGIPDAAHSGVTARSSGRIPSLRARAASALDGDPRTSWQSPIGQTVGMWLDYEFPTATRFDHLDMVITNDRDHSVPTRMHLEIDGKRGPNLDLSINSTQAKRGATFTHTFTFPPQDGKRIRLVIDAAREVTSIDWFSGRPIVQPVGIAEIGIPGATMPPTPAELPGNCRTDLLTVAGSTVPLAVTGTTTTALDRGLLNVAVCGSSAKALSLSGDVRLDVASGLQTGVNLDQLVLSSPGATTPGATTPGATTPGATTPGATTPGASTSAGAPTDSAPRQTGHSSYEMRVTDARAPYWVVLGQSFNAGWRLRVDGRDLGPSRLINGYANGWQVDPATYGADATITLDWTPQKGVWVGLAISAVGVLLCLVLVRYPKRRASAQAPHLIVVHPVAPLDRHGAPLDWPRTGVLSTLVLVVGWATTGPFVAPVLAVGAVIAFHGVRSRPIVRLAPLATFGLAIAYTVAKQFLNDYQIDFGWTAHYAWTHWLGLATVGLLIVDALAEALRAGWRRDARIS